MAENNTKERITRNEERIKTLFSLHELFREDMLRCQQSRSDEVAELRIAIQELANDQYHELISRIKDAKKANRRPLNRIEWTAIMVAIIGGFVSVFTALIEYGVI